MNSHITHYASVKQNNDFILYHSRAKSSLSPTPHAHAHDKSPISELMKDFTKNQIMLSREERLPLSGVSSPKSYVGQSPKLVTLRELPEGVIEPKPFIQTERERRATDLEKENKELKSLLKSRDIKLAQFLKENENIQKRLGEYKSKEKLGNFNQIDIDTLKEDFEKCLAQIQTLEKEKADLLADRSTWFRTTEEIDQGLQKYTKYVLHYVNKTDNHNFINFCFEDRFSSEKSLLILLQTKNYGIIALQAFKYLSDLLTRIGALQNPNQEQQSKSPNKPRGSEPSSICLSPLKNESREGTPRDLVKEMIEGTRLFLENFDKPHHETPTPNSYKSPKNNGSTLKKDEIKNTLKKSSTAADLHKKQAPNTSRNVRIDVTNSATRLALKKQLSPKQSVTPQPQRQGTPKSSTTTTPSNTKSTYAKMHAKNEAVPDMRRWTEKENIGDQSGSKKLTLVERLEKEDKNRLENERVVLFSECASRRNSGQVRKEADVKAKVSAKNDVRKSSNSNIGKLDARRDSHTSALRTKNTNISENQFSKRASMSKADHEESDRKSPFSVKSILKNAFENKDAKVDKRCNSNEDFLDILDGPSNLNKKRNREPLEIQIDVSGKRPRNQDENKEEYFSQKGCASSDVFPKEKTSPKALVGSLNFDSLRNRGSPTANLMSKDNVTPPTKDNKALYRETPLLSSDDRLGRVLNQSPLSIEGGGDSSARWLAKDLAMFKTIPEPQPQDKLEQSSQKISYEDLRIVHFDDETKLAPQKFIARQMSRQEAAHHKTKEEKAERFVTFDGNDDLFTCGEKGDTPSQSASKRNTPKSSLTEHKNLFTSAAPKVSFDMIPEKDKAQEYSVRAKDNLGTLEFNTSRSNYNVRDHQADGYSSARNRIFASEISGITHADKSLGGDEWY